MVHILVYCAGVLCLSRPIFVYVSGSMSMYGVLSLSPVQCLSQLCELTPVWSRYPSQDKPVSFTLLHYGPSPLLPLCCPYGPGNQVQVGPSAIKHRQLSLLDHPTSAIICLFSATISIPVSSPAQCESSLVKSCLVSSA